MWWSDEVDVDGKILGYIRRCQITLIDFGFSRALSPDDLATDVGLDKVAKESETVDSTPIASRQNNDREGNICVNDMLHDTSIHNLSKSRGRSMTRKNSNIDASQSHKRVRGLSALGHRNYAAPEIRSGLRRASSFLTLSSSTHSKNNPSSSKSGELKATTKRSLAECVSSYGMVADSYSGELRCGFSGTCLAITSLSQLQTNKWAQLFDTW
jgi:hypothetical protein